MARNRREKASSLSDPRGPLALAGQSALVTGAAKRLGRAVVLALARAGVNVVVHYHASAAEAEATAREARRRGVRAWTIRADVAEPEEMQGLLPRAIAAAGPLDILVNNAAVFASSRLTDFTPEDLRANIETNALAPLMLARGFTAQHREGVIINFLDARISDYDREHVAYHLSKLMLHALTRMMALEFAPRVRVNAVAPGLVLPPPGRGRDYLRRRAHTNPLGRVGAPEDIADAVVFLARSSFVTGQVIYVDGGRHLRGCVYG